MGIPWTRPPGLNAANFAGGPDGNINAETDRRYPLSSVAIPNVYVFHRRIFCFSLAQNIVGRRPGKFKMIQVCLMLVFKETDLDLKGPVFGDEFGNVKNINVTTLESTSLIIFFMLFVITTR